MPSTHRSAFRQPLSSLGEEPRDALEFTVTVIVQIVPHYRAPVERSWGDPVMSRCQGRGRERCSECAARSARERRSGRNIEDPVYPEKIGDVEGNRDGNPVGQILVLLRLCLARTAGPAFCLYRLDTRRPGPDHTLFNERIERRDREAPVALAVRNGIRTDPHTDQIAQATMADPEISRRRCVAKDFGSDRRVRHLVEVPEASIKIPSGDHTCLA